MNTASAYTPDARFTLTPLGAEYLAARAPYGPSNDPAMNPAAFPEGEPDDDGRDEDFTGETYSSALAPADDDDVIPFP